ncbi:hypothetical protein M422DRAFT_43173 [Sphaerobolus stellatus SS14]|nr:hypothetical protein M422DRAFT_43173 [Sphaerobolus stellatus SS14]
MQSIQPGDYELSGLVLKYEPTPAELAEHQSLMWTIQNTTNPDAITSAAELVPFVFWPRDIRDVETVMRQLQDTFKGCCDSRGGIIHGSEGRARACYIAVLYLYCSRWPWPTTVYTEDVKNWLRTRFGAVGDGTAAMCSLYNQFLRIRSRVTSSAIDMNDDYMLWYIRITNHYLAHMSNIQLELDEIDSVIGPIIPYYASTPAKGSITSHLLFCFALVLGFQPEINFLGLLDKR